MSKFLRADFEPSNVAQLKKALGEENLSFVLITCTQPSGTGEMNVEMDYAGDPLLIGCLIEQAQGCFN